MDDREQRLQALMVEFLRSVRSGYDWANARSGLISLFQTTLYTYSYMMPAVVPILPVLDIGLDAAFNVKDAIGICDNAKEFVNLVMSAHYLPYWDLIGVGGVFTREDILDTLNIGYANQSGGERMVQFYQKLGIPNAVQSALDSYETNNNMDLDTLRNIMHLDTKDQVWRSFGDLAITSQTRRKLAEEGISLSREQTVEILHGGAEFLEQLSPDDSERYEEMVAGLQELNINTLREIDQLFTVSLLGNGESISDYHKILSAPSEMSILGTAENDFIYPEFPTFFVSTLVRFFGY
jgi:hypothetical protein